MNRDRAHGRWLLFRLALLFPAFAGALATSAVIVLQEGQRRSLRVASLSLSLLLAALLGWFLVQTLACARLQRARRFREARVVRRLLFPSSDVALLSLLVVCPLAGLPFLVPDAPSPARAPAPRSRPVHAPPAAPALAASLPDAPPPAIPAPPAPDPAPPPPALPLTLVQAAPGPDEDDRAAYRFDVAPLRDLPPLPAELRLDRAGLPDERDPDAVVPVLARLDALLLEADGDRRAPAMSLLVDFPLGREGSFRATYLVAMFPSDGGEPFEGDPELGYARATFEYVLRLAGHTRHASFDLSVSAGLSVDAVEGSAAGLSGSARLSPYVAVDAGLFQSGAFGLLLHAGQSLPLNVTGASAATTDLSAVVRIDLSENVSLHAGYRLLLVRFRDYDASLDLDGDVAAYDGAFAGPQFGIEVRF